MFFKICPFNTGAAEAGARHVKERKAKDIPRLISFSYGDSWCYIYDRNLVGAENVHLAFCDVCMKVIQGTRFVCVEDVDYDECSACHAVRKPDGKTFHQTEEIKFWSPQMRDELKMNHK